MKLRPGDNTGPAWREDVEVTAIYSDSVFLGQSPANITNPSISTRTGSIPN